MSESTQTFEQWAVVEVMGHHSYAGKVSEFTLAGAGFIRVDVPEVTGSRQQWSNDVGGYVDTPYTRPAFSKILGTSSIYAITPVSEEVARVAAQRTSDPLNVYVPALNESPTTVARLTHDDVFEDDLDEELTEH